MTVLVTPNNSRNTHHLSLSDGTTTVGLVLCDENGNANPKAFRRDPIPRSSLKIYSGSQKWADLEPPWVEVAQDDWSGGRGGERFEDDQAKYWDGLRVDTTRAGGFCLGPLESLPVSHVVRASASNWRWSTFTSSYTPLSYIHYQLYGTPSGYHSAYIAVKFSTPSTWPAAAGLTSLPEIMTYLKMVGSPTNPYVYLDIWPDVAGSPSAPAAINTAYYDSVTCQLCLVGGASLVSGLAPSTDYWLVIYGNANDTASNYHSVVLIPSTSTVKVSSDGNTWSAAGASITGYAPLFYIGQSTQKSAGVALNIGPKQWSPVWAETKGSLYCGVQYWDGTASKVLLNGTCGVATSGTSTTVVNTNDTQINADNRHVGAIVKLVDGTGSLSLSPWDAVLSENSGTKTLTVNTGFPTTPAAGSYYAVSGLNCWEDVTWAGATEIIYDMLGVNNAIYFALGDSTALRRLRMFWTAGAPGTHWNWTSEANNYATRLESLQDGGTQQIWAASRKAPAAVKAAPQVDCSGTGAAAALVFATPINVGDTGDNITGLTVYGSSFPILYVLKEGGIYEIVKGLPYQLRIAAMHAAKDERNGFAAVASDVYLYFSFLDSLERYYNGSLDDIGPQKGGALPYDRKGRISALAAYPGRLYAAIDAGWNGYSSIMLWNNTGWHEVWRAPVAGRRITGELYVQPIPGDNADRLWFGFNSDPVCLPVSLDAYRHNTGSLTSEPFQYYPFSPGGSLTTGWITGGQDDIDKLFKSVKVVLEQAPGNGIVAGTTEWRVYVDYIRDGDASWTVVGQVPFYSATGNKSMAELSLGANVTAKKLRLRLRIETDYANRSPRIIAVVTSVLATVPHKYASTITFRALDFARHLDGRTPDEYQEAEDLLTQLSTWASSSGALTLHSNDAQLDGKTVKIDPASIRKLSHTEAADAIKPGPQGTPVYSGRAGSGYICQALLYELD